MEAAGWNMGKLGRSAGLHSFSAVLLLSGQCTPSVGSSIPLNNLCVCVLEIRSHYVVQSGLNLVTPPVQCDLIEHLLLPKPL